MSTKEELAAAVAAAKAALVNAESALEAFDTSPENNVFATLEEAEGVLEDRMRDWAFRDCEGAHNCGADEYTQEFIVDGKHYMATAKFEYNRHDKMYYYIYGCDFSIAPIEATAEA